MTEKKNQLGITKAINFNVEIGTEKISDVRSLLIEPYKHQWPVYGLSSHENVALRQINRFKRIFRSIGAAEIFLFKDNWLST